MPAPVLRDPETFALVGAGAAATVLGKRLVGCGLRVETVVSRTAASAEALAATLGAAASTNLAPAAQADALVLAVPDDALAGVVAGLAALEADLSGTLVLHLSGVHPVRVLAGLRAQRAYGLGFHVAQALTRATPPEALLGVAVGLEGREPALSVGRRLAVRLGLRPLVIRLGSKALYHLALSMASNYTVTLTAVAEEVLASAGIDGAGADALLRPLLAGTLDNLRAHGPAEALTGPIVRGDVATVEQHLVALRALLPHLVPAYAALAAETVRLARASERLDAPRADALLDVIEQAVR